MLILLSEENEQWGMPLLTSMYLGFGTCYTDSDLNRMRHCLLRWI